jgi:hypothetical protein
MRTKRRKLGKSIDPTPALPTGEGDLKTEFNYQADYFGDWKTGEYKGQKPAYITANSYTYPIIKDYRKDLKEHQTEAELILWQFLRNNKTGHISNEKNIMY